MRGGILAMYKMKMGKFRKKTEHGIPDPDIISLCPHLIYLYAA
jgi:hypothetical protein